MLIATAIIAAVTVSAFGLRPQMAHATGFKDGYRDARSAVRDGGAHDDSCSFDNSDAYCADYKLGYAAGWATANLVH